VLKQSFESDEYLRQLENIHGDKNYSVRQRGANQHHALVHRRFRQRVRWP